MTRCKPGPAPLSAEIIAKIRALYSDDFGTSQVARMTGVSVWSARRYRPRTDVPIPHAPLSRAERLMMHKLSKLDMSPRRIAMAVKRSEKTVARELVRVGLRSSRTLDRVGPAEIDYLGWAHGKGHTQTAIARHLDRDIGTIRRYAYKLGLQFKMGAPEKMLEVKDRLVLGGAVA